MGAQHSTRASRAVSRKTPSREARHSPRPNARTDLPEILGRLFDDVSSIFEVVCRSLDNDDDHERISHARTPEAITLRHGLALLAVVYTDFDEAIPEPPDAQLAPLAKEES